MKPGTRAALDELNAAAAHRKAEEREAARWAQWEADEPDAAAPLQEILEWALRRPDHERKGQTR